MSEAFFAYARERYLIFLRKESGSSPPYTADPILQQYRFCNVFREDDRVTRWVAENIRCYGGHPYVFFALLAFRLFNRISTGEILLGGGDIDPAGNEENLLFDWNSEAARQRLRGVTPLVGAAYMCPTEPGMTKLESLIDICNRVWTIRYELSEFVSKCSTMQALVERLSQLHYMGRFRSYEVACDLQYGTTFKPTDTLTWANPGPGAERGLSRIYCSSAKWPTSFHRDRSIKGQIQMMRELLEDSADSAYWPRSWPRWDMRTVEHTLCEFDKYERVRLGEGRPKQKINYGP